MEIGMAAKEDGEGVSQKKEIRESWILRWRLSTKEQAKEKWGFSKDQNWNEAAKVERSRGRRAAAREEEKGKRRVAKEIPERVGRAARQDTLQLCVGKEETHIKTPLTKTTLRTLKSRPRMRRSCKHGACWKKVRTNSGKR